MTEPRAVDVGLLHQRLKVRLDHHGDSRADTEFLVKIQEFALSVDLHMSGVEDTQEENGVKGKIIPNVLEANPFPRLWKEEDLTRLFHALTIQQVGFVEFLRAEVAEASTTPKPLVVSRLIAHKGTDRFDPGVVFTLLRKSTRLWYFFMET